MALSKQLTRSVSTRAKTRVNEKNKKVCQAAMEFTKDKGKGPNPYCYAGGGQTLCKGLKSTIQSWANKYSSESNFNHILGTDKDDKGRNWNWTMQEDSTDYKAVDCSGLTMYCYDKVGIKLSHGSESQRDYGINKKAEVPLSEAQPGDLIWKSGHCAIVGENGTTAAEAQGWRWGCTYSRDISKFTKCFHLTGEGETTEPDPGTDPDPGVQPDPGALLTASEIRSAILYNKRANQSICKQIQILVGVTPDGSFGTSTINAIAAWQKSKGLEVDGKFGPASKAAAGFTSSAPIVTTPETPSQTVGTVQLTSSEQASAISYNKRNNQSICKRIQTLVGVTADGSFGPITVNAIAIWQAGKGLEADGKFGPKSKAAAGF